MKHGYVSLLNHSKCVFLINWLPYNEQCKTERQGPNSETKFCTIDLACAHTISNGQQFSCASGYF